VHAWKLAWKLETDLSYLSAMLYQNNTFMALWQAMDIVLKNWLSHLHLPQKKRTNAIANFFTSWGLNILDKYSPGGDCFAAGDGGEATTTVTTVAQPGYVQTAIPQTTTVITQ